MNLKPAPKMAPMKERAMLLKFVESHAWMAGFSGLDTLFRYEETVAKHPSLASLISRHGSWYSRMLDLKTLRRDMPHLRGIMLRGFREGRAWARRERDIRRAIVHAIAPITASV